MPAKGRPGRARITVQTNTTMRRRDPGTFGMKPKILVVDDEPDALELVRVNLTNAGLDVVTANNGEAARCEA